MSPRPQIDHIRRPQLLKAAAAVISERGVAATRIADVAEHAGTSPSTILYWFDSRDELLAEALTYTDRTASMSSLPNASRRSPIRVTVCWR